MESVTAVRELETQVRRRMADVTFTIDPPASSSGSWWIDVQRYGRVASIEWKPGKGFGVAAPHGGYGEGVDFIIDDAAAAAEYVARVLQPHSSSIDLSASAGSNALEQQLVAALASHIDRVVGEIVHTTVEKLLIELRKQAGDVPVDVRRLESELSRIAEQVLAERKAS
ncbi:MAG: hypothetical protein QOJ98_1321 [Acidobacteriota bacterium]|nr:hypothetical protein [Acidobacteriota bacterium]